MYYCWRALYEPARYSLQQREEAKICRIYDQKNAQSMGFLIVWGIHSWAMTSRRTYVDEIERFQVNFFRVRADYKRGAVSVYNNNGYFYIIDVFFLWKYSSRSRSRAF